MYLGSFQLNLAKNRVNMKRIVCGVLSESLSCGTSRQARRVGLDLAKPHRPLLGLDPGLPLKRLSSLHRRMPYRSATRVWTPLERVGRRC